jgi:hypothetical protein
MCVRRAVYLWTGYWSIKPAYLAMEPTDPENIPMATALTLLSLTGLLLAWQRKNLDFVRYGGAMFLFPIIYYFNHPEPYHMRAIDPLVVILGSFAVVTWRERAKVAVADPAVPAVVVEA